MRPTYAAASNSVAARSSPWPAGSSNCRSMRCTTLCVVERLPAESSTNTRSPLTSKRCILLYAFTWCTPPCVRESLANTRP